MERPNLKGEQHEAAIAAGCVALADELLAHKLPDSPLSFVDMMAVLQPQEVLELLRESPIGQLLAADDDQLAIESDGGYYPVLDIRKSGATLTDASVRAYGWDYDMLQVRQLDIALSYDHPVSRFLEILSLRADSDGDLGLDSSIYAATYAETGYEGHGGKRLRCDKKQAAAEFAGLVVAIVGDTPESIPENALRVYREYESRVVSTDSLAYLQEWAANSWAGQVLYDLTQILVDAAPANDITLYTALTMREHMHEAHNALVDHVNCKRAERNKSANSKKLVEIFGVMEPWVDLVPRTMPTSRIRRSPPQLIR